MESKNVTLFVFDEEENYKKTIQFIGESQFKKVVPIYSDEIFDQEFEKLEKDDYVYLIVHVFYTLKIKGIRKYAVSKIKKEYPLIGEMFVSEGSEEKIKTQMIEAGFETSKIYKYHNIQTNIEDNIVRVYKKKDIIRSSIEASSGLGNTGSIFPYQKFNYAILTALYEDEFEQLKDVFDFPSDEEIHTATKIYYGGYLKTNKKIRVIVGVQNIAGMVDASIIATQMLEFFRPDYLLMSGVCGGSSDFSFGDIIVAKSIFTFQKGKISDIKRSSKGKLVNIDLFDIKQNKIDYSKLFDNDGNQISISIEKFQKESEHANGISTKIEDAIRTKKIIIEKSISDTVNERAFFPQKKDIKVEIAPMACSTMVINKHGFFEDTIKVVDRKTAAVEMESYGVARACMFANNGKTIPIIFKSVMDHTSNKSDSVDGINYKKFAAFTSAQFLKSLFENGII